MWMLCILTLFGLGVLRVPGLGKGAGEEGGGGGWGWERERKVAAAHNSKTINDNEIKFSWVVENRKLINLV